MLKYTLLGFLGYRPMSGYDLKQTMDRSTTHFWHAKQSQIYVTLKALEEAGWVTSTLEEQQERPDRRVYSITPAGRREFLQWLAELDTELEPKKETVILKLFFSAQLDRETLLTQLYLQRDLLRQKAEYFRDVTPDAIQKAAAMPPGFARDAVFWEATRRFGQMHTELYIHWLEEMIQLVEEMD